MNVDYRLLARFQASHDRLAAARATLPEHWQSDPRPEAQAMNDHWVNVIAKAAEDHARGGSRRSETSVLVSVDDR